MKNEETGDEAFTHRGNGRSCNMNNTLDIGSRSVYCRMQLEACHVHAEVRRALLDNRALHIDLDQTGGGDLVIEQSIRIHQEVLLILIEPGGDVAADTLRPSVQIEQSEDRRQLASQQLLALGVSHALHAANVVDR